MYPTSLGTLHMRTGLDIQSWGKREYEKDTNRYDLEGNEIIQYSAVIPDYVKCYTEYLRAAGYYCTNNQKTDYQFAAPVTAWDENNNKAHCRNAPKDKPFFSVFNIGATTLNYSSYINLTILNLSNNSFACLDISNLTNFLCHNNLLLSLDLRNGATYFLIIKSETGNKHIKLIVD